MSILQTIRASRNTSVQWTSLNPILGRKEIGVEEDTDLFKVGDGQTHWRNLAYSVSNMQNALFIFLSEDPDNILAISTDGGIYLGKQTFNGLPDYTAGKEQGPAAPTPPNEFNATVLRIGQDVFTLMSQLVTLANRVTLVEARPEGVVISDTEEVNNKTWSSEKIVDKILSENLALKNDITNNPDGAYDALVRLATLLQDNDSLALVVTTELGNTIRFNEAQTLTQSQQAQARSNIDAVGTEDIGNTSDLLQHYEDNLVLDNGSTFQESEI